MAAARAVRSARTTPLPEIGSTASAASPTAAVRTDQVGVTLWLRPAPGAAGAVRRQRVETGELRPHPEFGQQRRCRRGERLTDARRVELGPFQQNHPAARLGEPPGGGRACRSRPDDGDVVIVSHDGGRLASAPCEGRVPLGTGM